METKKKTQRPRSTARVHRGWFGSQEAAVRETLSSRDRVESASSFSSVQATPKSKIKRMPKLVYNTYKNPELKRMLKALGLKSTGDRATIIWRHKEYTKFHNAACDSFDPKDAPNPAKLRKRVQQREEALSSSTKNTAGKRSASSASLSRGFASLAAKIKSARLHRGLN